jgi:hypothetical protein
MPTKQFTTEIITAAILGFESQKQQIDTRITELRQMLSGGPAESAAAPEPTKRKRRKMSAAARSRIAEAQRKRWAASRVQAYRPRRNQRSPNGNFRRRQRQMGA